MSALEEMTVEVEAVLPAPPEVVFALVTDVERVAGLGPEHAAAAWRGDGRGVGAVFDGTNRRGDREWTVPCVVTAYDPPGSFGWLVGDPAQPSAWWSWELTPVDGGTRAVHAFRHGPGFTFLRRAVERAPEREAELVAGRAADLGAGMRAVLAALPRLLP